jgi:hypothetical protein
MRRAIPIALGLAWPLFDAGDGFALEKRAMRFDDDDRENAWQSGCTTTIRYFNICTGWIWVWSGWLTGPNFGTVYDIEDCPYIDYTNLLTSSLWAASDVPTGYGYTGTLELYSVDSTNCLVGNPIATRPILPKFGWNTVPWGGLTPPSRFGVVYKRPDGDKSGYPEVGTDHPAVGPTGPQGCGVCFPLSRDPRSFQWFDESGCPGPPFWDGVCNAELLLETTGTFISPPRTFHLEMVAFQGGTVIPPSGDHLENTPIQIQAFADSGYAFAHWIGTGYGSYSGLNNPAAFSLLDDVVEQAFFIAYQPFTIATSPLGKRIVVDGIESISPTTYSWLPGSPHTISVDSLIADGFVTRERLIGWSDGAGIASRSYVAPSKADTLFAIYQREHLLEIAESEGGASSSGAGWWAQGSSPVIEAFPLPTHRFLSWTGSGNGSYSGPDNPATLEMLAPIQETPAFEPLFAGNGYHFTISASDSDPHEQTATPTGQIRSLYLWMTCSDRGIAAFEAHTSGTLAPLAFFPETGILNVGSAEHLLMAIPGCPTGTNGPVLLGHWWVIDQGGTFCLASPPSGAIGAVDCDPLHANLWLDPRVEGFSSSAEQPCVVGMNACAGESTWATAAPPDVAIATSFYLKDVRPNPFTNECVIEFGLANDEHAAVAVYDVAGRLVRRIVAEQLAKGNYLRNWNGRDANGERVRSGIYFVEFEAGTTRETKKIVYLQAQ